MGFNEIHSRVEDFYAVVMWALCVAFVGLLDLHEFQLARWEVSRVNSIGDNN